MINFEILSTGSQGNCYLLWLNNQPALIECGRPYKEIQSWLFEKNIKFTDLLFVFISHEHKDHAKALPHITQKTIPIFLSEGTMSFLQIIPSWNIYQVKAYQAVPLLPDLRLSFFPLIHDSAEPLGLVVDYHQYRFVYITDTQYIPLTFSNITHLAVECNYIQDLLFSAKTHKEVKKRVIKTHLSLDALKTFLARSKEKGKLNKLKEIWILHMSDVHCDSTVVKKEIQAIVPDVKIYI